MTRIITDSTSDLPASFTKQHNITVVPLKVIFGEERFDDGIDLTPEEFYEKMANSAKLPTTSQPTPEQFMAVFEEAKQNGDDVVCITISSELSGTYQSASIAKQEVEYDNIHIIDSKSATLAAGLLVELALKLKEDNLSAKDIASELLIARDHLHLLAIVDDLTNLRKGGRLSGAAAIAGSLLGIKPVIAINGKLATQQAPDGKVKLAAKARGLAGAYLNVFKMIEAMGGVSQKFSKVRLGYAGNKSSSVPFVQYFENKLNLKPEEALPIGSVVGTHAGSGAAGIAFFDAQYA